MKLIRRPRSVATREPVASVTIHHPLNLRVSRGRQLGTGWDDSGIDAMGAEDGQAAFGTTTWGDHNRDVRVVAANNAANGVASALIGQQLYGELTDVEQQLERETSRFPLAEDRVLGALADRERAVTKVEQLEARSEADDVEVPATHRSHHVKEIAALVALGLGDLLFTSKTFELFGLSDKSVGPLPFNELQLAASATVFALLFLARCTGGTLRTFVHLLGETLFHRYETGDEPANRRRLARLWSSLALFVSWLAAGVVMLVAVSAIRSTFLKQQNIDAQQSSFIGIQLGIFLAGIAMAYFFAHPLEREWKRNLRHLDKTNDAVDAHYAIASGIVSTHNGLLRRRVNLLEQYGQWLDATSHDTQRQNALYARRVMLAQPEPTTDQLFDQPLAVPVKHELIDLIARHANGDNHFKSYKPLTLDRIHERLRQIDARRSMRHSEEPSAVPQATPSASNGHNKDAVIQL